jgi:hypothetical protein
LHVSERHAGVEGGGDERGPERVRPDRLVDPRLASQSPHDSPGGMTVEALTVASQQDGPLGPLADGQVDRSCCAWRERDGDNLGALAPHRQRAVPAFEAERLDVSSERLGDPQTVDRQQRDERVVARGGEPGGDEQCADLVAVKSVRVRLVVETRSTNMHRR